MAALDWTAAGVGDYVSAWDWVAGIEEISKDWVAGIQEISKGVGAAHAKLVLNRKLA